MPRTPIDRGRLEPPGVVGPGRPPEQHRIRDGEIRNPWGRRGKPKGKLRGKKPKLTGKQQVELRRMHGTGDYSVSDLAELFWISRPTVYRMLERHDVRAGVPPLSPRMGAADAVGIEGADLER